VRRFVGTYKVRNEIETERNETKRNQRKRSETKSTKTKRNETKHVLVSGMSFLVQGI
jgi:hypothetical protein